MSMESPSNIFAQLFGDESFDHRLGFAVGAFTNMAVPDYAHLIDHHNSGPGPDAVALPNSEVIVLYHRKFNAQTRGRVFHPIQRFLPGKFRRVDTDDGQSGRTVIVMPNPQLRDVVSTVDSAISPKLDQDDSAPEAPYGERFAVDPVISRKIRCRLSTGQRRAGARPSRPKHQCQSESRCNSREAYHIILLISSASFE